MKLNSQLLASCYLHNNQAYCAYHILKGTQMAQSRYLFAISCFHMDLLSEAEAALCPSNESSAEVPNGAAGHFLLGLIYRYTDRRKNAVDQFKQALSMDPLLWAAYEELCTLGSISNQNPDPHSCGIYALPKKGRPCKVLWKLFVLGCSKGACDATLPCTPLDELISVDYNCEVDDDILPIFGKGEEFNYGIEFVLLISVVEGAVVGCIVDALDAFINLTLEYPSLIAQATQGSNFNPSSSEYTHAAVIRFRSSEAFKMFVGSPSYRELWMSKFEPITKKSLAVQYSIEPVGTEIM